jgi:hypothetical protein
MPRWSARMALVAPALISVACAETSPSGVVVAPVAPVASPSSISNASAQPGDASAPDAAIAVADPSGPSGDAGGAPARFRACLADADCVAVPRAGCCHNGWNEAVASSQKEAYAASFACPDAHPICAMFIVRDTRSPRCDPAAHLCTLVTPAKN